MNLRTKFFAVVILSTCTIELSQAKSLTNGTKKLSEPMQIKNSPTPADWKYFNNLTDLERNKLFGYHQKRGLGFKDWAWEWRIGWVRSCSLSSEAYCRKLLKSALFDKALVVRASAVDALESRFKKSESKVAVSLLRAAYQNPRNYRNSKPLYIQEKILFALRAIGGKDAIKVAEALSKNHSSTIAYWKKISKI